MTCLRLGTVAYSAIGLLFACAAGCSTSSKDNGAGSGGSSETGGTVGSGGKVGTGGTVGSGGAARGGSDGSGGAGKGGSDGTGGAAAGGVVGQGGASKTGGVVGSGGTNPGGRTGDGGKSGNGGVVGSGGTSAPGGGTGGTTGPVLSGDGVCDIYEAAGTPCVAAYSMARPMYKAYTGPLYQVRKGGGSKNTGTGGTTQDVDSKDGVADSGAQDTFCGSEGCTVSILYDQSPKKNDLKVAPAGCYTGTASEADYESSATKKTYNLNGHKVYGLYMNAHEGYRNNKCTGVPTKTTPDSVYVIADGTHAGSACCWDFGNVWGDNCNQHVMNPIFFGTGYWGKGEGSGPWFMGDFEGGVWAGGSGASNTTNSSNPSMKVEFAFGMLKTSPGKYAIKAGNAQSGALKTAYDGNAPKTWDKGGNILLGIGGDNSNSSNGTFYEGAVVSGLPSDATDNAVFANVQAAGFGK